MFRYLSVVMLLCLSVVGNAEELGTLEPTIDPVDLEAYVDGIVLGRLKAMDVVGVTVSIVHRGERLFTKGYGYDDLEAKREVDPGRSLFRPGSISKTLTWTAVMQLYEQGKLELDVDLQRYLPEVELPNRFDKPITMLDLMAHTPGLEDSALGHLFEDRAEDVLPLTEYLQTHQPEQVRPPGTWPAYSNYGAALAGQVVANVSGMPFEDYIDQYLLEPLGMRNTTFREPWGDYRPGAMPDEVHANSSHGYLKLGGRFVESNFEFIGQIGPAGALSTTAVDMATWMLTHLGGGAYDGVRILEPDTARLMHTRHFTLDPILNGLRHGFIEAKVHGYSAFGHGGGTFHFLSNLIMVPELDLGVFISTNTTGGGQLINGFPELIVKRYFPRADDFTLPEPPADFAERGARFAGDYIATRRAYSTLERLGTAPVMTVVLNDDRLQINLGSTLIRLVEIAPLTFQNVETGDLVKFTEDDDGAIKALYLSLPIMVMEKIGVWESPGLRYGIMVTTLVLMGLVLVGFWLRRGRELSQTEGERWAARSTLAMCVAWLAGIAMIGVPVVESVNDFRTGFYGFPQPFFVAGLTAFLLAAVLTLANTALLYQVWSGGQWPVWRKVRHTGVALLALLSLVFLYEANAIGYHYF
ncbi:MAG: serine hydrolase [Gammaproteobacteria bacterium]|nr:serine hydrolase [Gammaproteobacteria bacterium]